MYYAEAIVAARYGTPRPRKMLDDPRVIDFLRTRDVTPWAALKQMFRWLIVPAGGAL